MHIHPIFERQVRRNLKETISKQKAHVYWFTGLSGSGKSTLALSLEALLQEKGILVALLDGDNIRTGLNAGLSFTLEDRHENIRRVAEVAKLFLDNGISCLVTFISPEKEMRALAASIIGEDNFSEVYINAPLETCEARDVKGLYAKARKGEIKNFTGIDARYEAPESPQLEIRTDLLTQDEAIARLLTYFEEKSAR